MLVAVEASGSGIDGGTCFVIMTVLSAAGTEFLVFNGTVGRQVVVRKTVPAGLDISKTFWFDASWMNVIVGDG